MPIDGGIASATANTDMVMPTATSRTADAIEAFAQILDSSVVSANQTLSDSTPTLALGSRQANETVTSLASPGTGRKAIKLHQAVDPSVPASSNALSSRSAATSDPMNNVARLPAILPVPANVETVATDLPFDASGEITEHQQTLDAQRFTSSATPYTADASPSEWGPEAIQTAGARLQAVGALPALPTSTRPLVAHAGQGNDAARSRTVWTGAERFTPFASAAPSMAPGAELAASAMSSAVVSDALAARTASDGLFPTTINAPIGNNAAVEPPQQPVDLTPKQRTQVLQHAEPALASISATAHANRLASNAPTSSFIADQTITSSRPAQNSSMMSGPAQQAPAPLSAKAGLTFDYAAQENSDSLPNFADQSTTTESQGKNAAIAELPAGNASNVATVPTPIAPSQVQESASAIGPNPAATRTDASPLASVSQASGNSKVTQVPSPKEILTDRTWASLGADALAPKSQSTQTDKSHHAAVPAISFVSDSNISVPRVGKSTSSSAALKTSIHRQEPPAEDSESGTGTNSPREVSPSASHTLPTVHIMTTTSSKLPGAIVPPLLLGSTPVTTDLDDLAMSQDEMPNILPLASNAVSPQQSVGAAPTMWLDETTRTAPTSSDTGTQSQANAHTSHSQDSVASAGPETLAQALRSSDAPVETQSLSVTASAPKAEVGNSSPASVSASLTSTPNNVPMPSATLVRNSAENAGLSGALQAWNGGDNAQTRLIQSATLGGNLRASEMSIALQAGTLGPVELHARVAGDVVGASIGVERHDAHAMIASELPALHQALHDRQLRVGDLSVFQGSVHSGGSSGDGRPSQHRQTASQRSAAPEWATEQSSALPEIAAFSEGHDTGTPFDVNGRLSVRA